MISGLLDCVVGIVQDVQEYLLQLLRVAQCRADSLVELLHHFHAMAGKIVAAQFDGLAQDRVHLDRFALRRFLPGETQQILHNLFRSLGLLQNDPQILARRFRDMPDFRATGP